MTGMFKATRISTVALIAVVFTFSPTLAQQSETSSPNYPPVDRLALWSDSDAPARTSQPSAVTSEAPMRPIDRLALLGDVHRVFDANATVEAKTPTTASTPVPFSISTMADDIVPPFAGYPTLTPATTDTSELKVSFKENLPVKKSEPTEVESIDECCHELTEMIAGNLESEISLEAKKQMIETALKMVARNVALKAEAKITKLKADHALSLARMQGQMGQMRSVGSAADQINRVAGPLSQIMQRNYQQSVAMNSATQQLSQSLAQLGAAQLEEEARVARANRQRIQLTSPPQRESKDQMRISQLTEQIAYLQQQLAAQSNVSSNIQRATYQQPLRPRRQPLEPLPQRNNFDNTPYQYLTRPRAQQR